MEAQSKIILDGGVVLTRCDQCRQMYAERKPPGTPPCESCRVELKVENEDAAEVYMMTRRQYVTRHNGRYDHVVDIDIPAVKTVMDLYGVGDQKTCLLKVRSIFHHFLKEIEDASG